LSLPETLGGAENGVLVQVVDASLEHQQDPARALRQD
jgi:hypothetical protein